ncbi:radical SAM protein [Candidatus Harpocratesius sp.]
MKNNHLFYNKKSLYLGQIHINHRCNIIPEARCADYCYQNLFQNQEMSFNTFKLILQKYRPHQIALGGGEPTLHPEFLEFIQYAKEQPFLKHVNYTTNGVKMPKNFFQVEQLVSGISLSLDTLRYPNLLNDGIPPVILKNLKMYQDSAIQVIINFVISEDNYLDLEYLCDFLEKYDLQIVYLLSIKRKARPFSPLRIPFIRTLHSFLIKAFEKGIIVARDCCLASYESKSNKCKAGQEFLAFDTDGTPMPCSFSYILENSPCHFINDIRTISFSSQVE